MKLKKYLILTSTSDTSNFSSNNLRHNDVIWTIGTILQQVANQFKIIGAKMVLSWNH